MWNNGVSPVRVIEHGVLLPPEISYQGELDRGLVRVIPELRITCGKFVSKKFKFLTVVVEAQRAQAHAELAGEIDRALHGSGPNIDNLETREERLLIPGVGFSIEPGVYIAGEIGVRSEVNAYITESGAEITPKEYQRDLIVV